MKNKRRTKNRETRESDNDEASETILNRNVKLREKINISEWNTNTPGSKKRKKAAAKSHITEQNVEKEKITDRKN